MATLGFTMLLLVSQACAVANQPTTPQAAAALQARVFPDDSSGRWRASGGRAITRREYRGAVSLEEARPSMPVVVPSTSTSFAIGTANESTWIRASANESVVVDVLARELMKKSQSLVESIRRRVVAFVRELRANAAGANATAVLSENSGAAAMAASSTGITVAADASGAAQHVLLRTLTARKVKPVPKMNGSSSESKERGKELMPLDSLLFSVPKESAPEQHGIARQPHGVEELEAEVTKDVDRVAYSIPSMSLPRFARVCATVGLCVLGVAVYLIHGGWVRAFVTPEAKKDCDPGHELRLRLWLSLHLLARLLFLHPFVEYSIHRCLHTFHVSGHLRHHTEVAQGLADLQTFEAWPYVLAFFAYPCPCTRAATLGLLQYAWFHQLSHDLPWLMPETSELHVLHHHHVSANYGISFPCVWHWPDRLFGSFRAAAG